MSLKEMRQRCAGVLLSCVFVSAISGCSTPTKPTNPENLCAIFKEKRDWYSSAKDMERKWNVPVHVPMAMMYQESSFRHDARPPKKYLFGIIPNGRISSAYGYSQALDGTWAEYQRLNRRGADRDDFDDSIDFMGWYMHRTTKINGVSKNNAYAQYLNYHEGQGGYKRRSYEKKPWLKLVAKKVDSRSDRYRQQMLHCNVSEKQGWFW